MCGIVGTLNTTLYFQAVENFIKDGMVVGTLRGNDSTGVVQVDRQQNVYTHKRAVAGPAFVNDKLAEEFITDACRSRVTLVHHRAATVGAVNKDNAHPFVVQKEEVDPVTKKYELVVGVHNGSLTGWKHKKGADKFTVDSNWALHHIAQNGDNAFLDITGPFCFVWVDTSKPNKLFIARNSGRPMHILMSKSREQMYFASEAGMLSWLCERNRIVTEEEIMVVGVDRIYEFDVSGAKISFTSRPTPKLAYGVNTTTTAAKATARVPAGPVTQLKPWRDTRSPELNFDGQTFIQKIKDACNTTAKAVPLETLNVDQAAVDAAVSALVGPPEELTPQRDDDAPTSTDTGDSDLVPNAWFSGKTASEPEQKLAKEWGMFRELQWFRGVVYDETSGETMGDIEVWEKDAGKVTYSGVLRGCSANRAQAQYIENNPSGSSINGAWVVVIGAREEKQLGKVLVVAELNNRGKAALEEKKKLAH